MARSPGRQPETSEPQDSTSATTSWPSNVPASDTCDSTLSDPQIPQPSTRIRTCPGPGGGTSTSRNSSSPGATRTCAYCIDRALLPNMRGPQPKVAITRRTGAVCTVQYAGAVVSPFSVLEGVPISGLYKRTLD
jgi:hypothetical protein